MEISGKGLTVSLSIITKSTNKKQKSWTAITDITNNDFSKLPNYFINSLYIGHNNKHFHNEPTEDYFFLIKQIFNTIQIKKHVRICTK